MPAEKPLSLDEIIEMRKKNAGGKVILNLGCGSKIWDNAINVDMDSGLWKYRPDVSCDITKLPFDDGFSDEVHAIHVFEHFYLTEAEALLKEWIRTIKSGGCLVLELPCLNKILFNFQAEKILPENTLLGLYGDQIPGHPEMIHKWCYTIDHLKRMMEVCGLHDVQYHEPLFHRKDRDMRMVGIK